MIIKEEVLPISGVNLEAQRIKQLLTDQGITLVFLHEGLGCISLWRDFPLKLSKKQKLPSFLYSRQGYCNSDSVPLTRPLTIMHKEGLVVLPKVLEQAGIERAILVGHSDGASIAIIYAGGASEQKVEAMILIAPHVFNEKKATESIRKAKIAFETTNLRDKLEKYHGKNVDCAFRGWNDVWLSKEFREWNIEQYLPNIKIPTLVVQGDNDEYGTDKQISTIVNGIGGTCEVATIPQCGHSPHLEFESITLSSISNFLNKNIFFKK
ncbi:MAG: alpha/beta hydrolase [Pseudomonadota bacterium]|nr:alpha/beta hydrolase [Pseudomonadota bacterium]